jgi:hypothetical protein
MIYFTEIGKLGRLGNQMFQYAALLAVAENFNYEFQIDFTATELSRAFILSAIDQKLVPSQVFSFKEKPHTFDKNLFLIKDNTNIEGFFQSFKYFENCQQRIRSEFKFQQGIELIAKSKIEAIKEGKQLVAVHVRRGDYVTRDNNIFTQDAIKLCKLNYYLKAMSLFENENIKFVIFSDDISWCKQNIRTNCVKSSLLVYVEGNNQYVDLCMMTLCDHNIISTSTFGWWGAWLNSNPKKKIIAPRRWFGLMWGNNTKDLYYDNWIVIGSRTDHIKYWIIEALSFLKIRNLVYHILIRIKFILFHPQFAINSLKKRVKNLLFR